MAITRLATSSLKTLNKYDDFLAGNPPYIPSSFESIATVTATGGESSLTFSSIPQTYKALQVRYLYKDTSTSSFAFNSGGSIVIRYSGDGVNSHYPSHELTGNGTTAAAYGNTSTAAGLTDGSYVPSGASYANMYGAGIIDFIDYASTTKYKTIRAFNGADTNGTNTNQGVGLCSLLWVNTSAITSMVFNPVNTFAAGSTFALYGIK